MTAPLEADGVPLGTLLLATRDRSRPLATVELALLVPLSSALAVALRGTLHLQQLTQVTHKLQAVVDQSSDGILVLDGGGEVQLWSPAFEGLTGVAAAAVGLPLASVCACSDRTERRRPPSARAGRCCPPPPRTRPSS